MNHVLRTNLSRFLLSVVACVTLLGSAPVARASILTDAFIRDTYNAMFATHEAVHEEMDAMVVAAAAQVQALPATSARIVQIAKIQAKTEKRIAASGKKMESRIKKMYGVARRQLVGLGGSPQDLQRLELEYLEVIDTIRTDVERRHHSLAIVVQNAL